MGATKQMLLEEMDRDGEDISSIHGWQLCSRCGDRRKQRHSDLCSECSEEFDLEMAKDD